MTFMCVMIKLYCVPQILHGLNIFGKEYINYMNAADLNMTGTQLCLPVALVAHTSGLTP